MTLATDEATQMEIDPVLIISAKHETLSPPTPSQLLLRRGRSHGSSGTTPTPLSPKKEDDVVTPQQGLKASLQPNSKLEPMPDMRQLHFRTSHPPPGTIAWSGDGGLSTTPGEMAQGQGTQWQPDEDARSYALAAQSVFPPEGGPVPPEPTEDGQNGDWTRRSWRSPGRTESTNSLNYAAEQNAASNVSANSVPQSYNPFAQVASFGGAPNPGSNGLLYTAQSASAANSPTARARARHQQQAAAIHRQSSKSSTRTASTSSEESDLCIPSIEWVNHERERERQPFYAQKMPPPPEPRTSYLAVGASASTPLGITQNQSLPGPTNTNGTAGGHANIPDSALETEEDDDAATVGQGRESPSTSSQSAQSGLDLLWKAVAHHESVPSTPQPQPSVEPPSDRARGKRKAGQEVVAQWRSGGYGGSNSGPNNQTAVSALRGGSPSASGAEDGNGGASSPAASGGPKKRRRSQLDAYDPALAPPSPEEQQDSDAASVYSLSASDDDDDNSDYAGGSSKGRRAPARGGRKAGGAARPKAAAPKRTKKATTTKARKVSMDGSEGAGGAQGVQCNYVFPRAPFPRCKDFFTRKYDLPRHMARHARREGELVYEGKLTEAEATLWKTIKDKPRVHCPTCGESFTRMDALKRHQTKQHHV